MAYKTLYTIGHSNHTFTEFISILKAHHINLIVDVRTIPKSRHVLWANKDVLKKKLAQYKISYKHFPKLGGLRSTNKQSINTAWRNKSFRGFADYMQTSSFYSALKVLLALIKKNRKVAIMCAEAVPWRCHRSLIADAALIRHFKVEHIMSKTLIRKHTMTSFAKINHHTRPIKVYYPAD